MTKQSQPRLAWRITGILVVAGSALAGACSSSGGHPSGSATSHMTSPASPSASSPSSPSASSSMSVSAATCQHVDSLRTSLQSLTNVQFNASSATTIRTDLTNIQTQLTALKGQASGAFASQASQLSASLTQVQKAAQGLSSPPTSSQVQAIIAALGNLKTKSQATLTEMNTLCPKK